MQIAISQTIKNECKDYFYITLGLLLYTFGWTIFLLPYQIVTGGVTGIAAVIYYGTGIPIYLSYFSHQCRLAACSAEDTGIQVHGEDHLCHHHALPIPGSGARLDDR